MNKLFWTGLVLEVAAMSYLGWQYAAARERTWARRPKQIVKR